MDKAMDSRNARNGDRRLVLDVDLEAYLTATSAMLDAFRIQLPTTAVRNLYELVPEPVWTDTAEDFSRLDVQVRLDTANAAALTWAAKWNLGRPFANMWARAQVGHWIESAWRWRARWLSNEYVGDVTRHFINAEPPWRYLPFFCIYPPAQWIDLAGVANDAFAEMESLPVNGYGENGSNWWTPIETVTIAPLSADPFTESLNEFLERAKSHWLQRMRRLVEASPEPLKLSSLSRREMETHCCWLIMSRVSGLSHQRIANTVGRTRATVGSAITALERTFGLKPLRHPPGRPRKLETAN